MLSNEFTARLGRELHPLRLQRRISSESNPWLARLGPTAQAIKERREPLAADDPFRRTGLMASELIGASLDFYRGLRDAQIEALFFLIYGNFFGAYLAVRGSKGVFPRIPG